MLPMTDYHKAPAKETNPYGQGMHHAELMRRLKLISPNIQAPLPEHYPGWFPGKEHGLTCLWLGTPSSPTSKKICAFKLGTIPEFTITDKKGNLIHKGWRAIFAKLIRARVTTKRDLERVFAISLDRNKKTGDGTCLHCSRAGKTVRSAGGADGLCVVHSRIQKICAKAQEDRKEQRWLNSLSPDKLADLSRPRLRLDLGSGKTPKSSEKDRLVGVRKSRALSPESTGSRL